MTQGQFAGKVGLVTGAASGIGRAVAEKLAEEGASVVCADRDEPGARQVAEAITAAGGKAIGVLMDASVAEDNERVAATAVEEFGGLDAVHLNAGIGTPNPQSILTMPVEDFDRVIAINLRSQFLGLQACGAKMANGGSIVLTSSVSGLRGAPGTAGYASAKHATIGLAKVGALDLAASGIRVNAVCPGVTSTGLFNRRYGSEVDARTEAMQGAYKGRIPAGRVGVPSDIANLVAFLLSEQAGYITGSWHAIDGGSTIMAGGLDGLTGSNAGPG